MAKRIIQKFEIYFKFTDDTIISTYLKDHKAGSVRCMNKINNKWSDCVYEIKDSEKANIHGVYNVNKDGKKFAIVYRPKERTDSTDGRLKNKGMSCTSYENDDLTILLVNFNIGDKTNMDEVKFKNTYDKLSPKFVKKKKISELTDNEKDLFSYWFTVPKKISKREKCAMLEEKMKQLKLVY